MVQCLGLCTYTTEGLGSIPSWGSKTLQVTQYSKKKKKKKVISPTFTSIITCPSPAPISVITLVPSR